MKKCECCKWYKNCSQNIYQANIERDYLNKWSNRDCWEEIENNFVKGLKAYPSDSCWDILNWYRNLYHKENDNTERGIVARAINEALVEHHSKLNKEKNTYLELIRMGKLPPLDIKKED